jgi:hypothetical protein
MPQQTVFASAARTATPTAVTVNTRRSKGLTLVFDVTAVTSTPSTTVAIEGYDNLSNSYFPILTSAAVATAVKTTMRVGPGLTAGANVTFADYLPDQIRISPVHGNANSMTYSISVHLLD